VISFRKDVPKKSITGNGRMRMITIAQMKVLSKFFAFPDIKVKK